MDLNEMWAKQSPFQSVTVHGLVSGYIAQFMLCNYICEGSRNQLASSLGLSQDELKQFIGYFVSLHDIGKIEKNFQNQNNANRVVKTRHEKTTAMILRNNIWKNDLGLDRRIAHLLADILGAHHQGKSGNGGLTGDGEWLQLQRQFEHQMREIFCNGEIIIPKTMNTNDQGVTEALLLGIVILSDWIASGNLFSEAESWNEDGKLKSRVEQTVESFFEESGLKPKHTYPGSLFENCWLNLKPRNLQENVERIFANDTARPLLMLIEAPMGEGKTEAAIYAAEQLARIWHKNGFYIGLPTSATANQMDDRMNQYFHDHHEDQSVKLMHGMAWMRNEQDICYDSEEEKYIVGWLDSSKRKMLSPYGVGTVDQAMMAAMNVKYGVLRLLGLAEKVLIIDEVHAYDLYMMEIITLLLNWCKALKIPVILLSATLPIQRKNELFSIYSDEAIKDVYPAITWVEENGKVQVDRIAKVSMQQRYELEILPYLYDYQKIAEKALKLISSGGCLCVILNTVKQAQDVYSELCKQKIDEEIMLFHSQFSAERRNEIEKTCVRKFGKGNRSRPKKSILVATQVVEQSLDVDFDVMITSIAPMDLLIQRIGRVFRHKETTRPASIQSPHIVVMVPEENDYGDDAYVYDSAILELTEKLLHKQKAITVPEDIKQLINDAYDPVVAEANHVSGWDYYETKSEEDSKKSETYKISLPEKKYTPLKNDTEFEDEDGKGYLSARTRLGEPSQRIIILPLDCYNELKAPDDSVKIRNQKQAQQLMKYIINVRKRRFTRYVEQYGIEYLNGAMLLDGTVILCEDNGYLIADDELGLIWKEGDNHV